MKLGQFVGRFGKYRVYEDDGRLFVWHKTPSKTKRRYGSIDQCAQCGKDYFRIHNGSPRWAHCSRKCATVTAKATKRAKPLKRITLDNYFSRVVRAEGMCRRCGAGDMLQCAHIISRRYLGVRYERDNAMCLCARCHMFFTYRPLEWEAYVVDQIGEQRYAEIRQQALAFQGPLDREAIARVLHEQMDSLGLSYHGPHQGVGRGGADLRRGEEKYE